MGDAAKMISEGILCEVCGEYVGKSVGHPRKCPGCGEPTEEELVAIEADDEQPGIDPFEGWEEL